MASSEGQDVRGLLWDTFAATNTHLVANSNVDCTLSGTTLTASVLRGVQLTTAWVGDSRAVLARRDGAAVKAYDLTVDHKPTLPEELKRIRELGGRVQPLVVRRPASHNAARSTT